MAKELLKKNVGNRRLKKEKYFYVSQMRKGLWKENGEPIIIDSNGFVKDGQHRLHAVIEANYSYKVPIISGVNPDVMDTIDTGLNRTLGDILELNGFKYSSAQAAAIRVILKHCDNSKNSSRTSGYDRFKITNSQGFNYALEHKEELYNLVLAADSITRSQSVRVLSNSDCVWFLYSLGCYNFNDNHVQFLKGCANGSLGSNSASYYAYKKLLQAKSNKITLSGIYKHNLIVKCWNTYAFDDQPIKKLIIQKERLEVPMKTE